MYGTDFTMLMCKRRMCSQHSCVCLGTFWKLFKTLEIFYVEEGKFSVMEVYQKSVKLLSGEMMPIIALGTYKIREKDLIYRILDSALKHGYRSFDTAAVYRNETEIGLCLKELLPKFNLKRKDIFITSKLGPKDQGKGSCRKAFLRSLSQLDCDYLDLYLVHWPGTQGMQPSDHRHRNLRIESWHDMIELHKEGKVKSIGVSNFLPHHINDLIQSTGVTPSVLQIECHPHLVQTDLKHYCSTKGIHFQAYSSLGTTTEDNKLLHDPVVNGIAEKIGVSVPQLLLKWSVQQGIGVIPKSTNPVHIAENIDIFSFVISDEHMKVLNGLDRQHHYCWDPSVVL